MSHQAFKQTLFGVLVALLFMTGPVYAVKSFKTSHFGNARQIWFEAEDYDERNPDTQAFYPVVDAAGAFGKAITRTGGAGGMIRWTFDISAAGGKAGTWYFWGRIINPGNSSDYMLVKGDPGDPTIPSSPPFPGGSGAAPFADADDRIFEGDYGPPWAWGQGWDPEGHVKELQDGENTMYIFHRQGNDTVFWDVFVWTDSPDYVPTDADYQNATAVLPDTVANPSPASGATDVPRNAALSWSQGAPGAKYDVYVGTDFEVVNQATTATAGVYRGRVDPNTYAVELLTFGQIYYWRVDKVNPPPDSKVFKGSVWNFTAEPYAYPIAMVTATASSSSITPSVSMTPDKTVNGSGLDPVTGLHSTLDTGMWLSAPGLTLPAWIQYQFDQAYMLQSLKVWNYNQSIETWVGFGAKTVTVEYSLDGTAWTSLGDVEFARGDGTDVYAANTIVDMAGVQAKFVRLTIKSNWGGIMPQTGLSEVRFSYVPVKAREPVPAPYAEGVAVDTTLDWREGRKAASHEVYFGTDKQAVADGTVPAKTTTESEYQPAALEFGQFYYWKVNEVNEAASWPGDVWKFATAEYGPIDDFESYTNESPNRVFQTWIDGYAFSPDEFFPDGSQGNGSNAMVGYDPSVTYIMETGSVHGGSQAMPVEYNNIEAPFYSEIERSWTTPQDWTTNGATTLSLWFQGRPAAMIETASGITLSGAGEDIYQGTDEFRYAYKKLTGDGSISIKVESVGTLEDWTKAGVMIRETLDPLAVQVHMISAARQSLVEWMYRSLANSSTTTQFNTAANTNPLPVWLKITRVGNAFTGEYSADGTTWTKITDASGTASTVTIVMPASVYVGMVVCSNSAGNLAVADFSQIKTTGNVTGSWQAADIGVVQPSNTAEQMCVAVQDNLGKTKVITHPDPKATLLGDWTQWTIPLADFTGVKMTAVKKMVIGFGDRDNAKAGGAGMIFIDDVQYGTPILPTGLVAQYSMENNTDDSSGNGHNGTAAGGPTFVSGPAGKGQAVQFNGAVGQFIDLGTFNPSERTGKLSVSLWANWKGPTGLYQGLIAKRNRWDAGQMMWQIEANNAAGNVTFSRNGSDPGSGNPILPKGEWAHVAVTFDKATARFYVNGSMTGSGAFSFGSNRDASVHIGACDSSGGNPFNGAIDEVRIYDVVLTDAEVRTLAGK